MSKFKLRRTLVQFKEFEGMHPLPADHAGDAPKNTKWFNGACRFHFTHVFSFPADLIEEMSCPGFGIIIIPADKHRRFDVTKFGIYHKGITHARKTFYKMGLRGRLL